MTDHFLVEAVANVALDIAARKGWVSADEVRAAMPNLPNKTSAFGAAFRLLKQSGLLVETGRARSSHSRNHGREIRVYAPGRPT